MGAFENAEIPFLVVGNRLAITDQMIAEEPQWMDFIRAFKASFERDHQRFWWLMVPLRLPEDT